MCELISFQFAERDYPKFSILHHANQDNFRNRLAVLRLSYDLPPNLESDFEFVCYSVEDVCVQSTVKLTIPEKDKFSFAVDYKPGKIIILHAALLLII